MTRARKREREQIFLLLALGVSAGIAGCTHRPPVTDAVGDTSKPAVATASCTPAQEDFTNALGFYAAPDRDGAGGQDSGARSAVALRADAQAADQALGQLVGTYGTLAACHAGTPPLADVRAALAALTGAGKIEAQLKQRLQGLEAGAVATGTSGAEAAPSIEEEIPYLATDDGTIFARPLGGGRSIAALRKGQRVTAPPDAASVPGWIAVDLNDGSTGYVRSDLLRRLAAPVRPRAPDTVADIDIAAQIIMKSLPQRRDSLQTRLGGDGLVASGGS